MEIDSTSKQDRSDLGKAPESGASSEPHGSDAWQSNDTWSLPMQSTALPGMAEAMLGSRARRRMKDTNLIGAAS